MVNTINVIDFCWHLFCYENDPAFPLCLLSLTWQRLIPSIPFFIWSSAGIDAWIGLYKLGITETSRSEELENRRKYWRWTDMSVYQYQRWTDGEPSAYRTEACARMTKNRCWSDQGCDKEYHFICKIAPGTGKIGDLHKVGLATRFIV